MSKKKISSLRGEITKLPTPLPLHRRTKWYERLKNSDPKFHAELCQLICDWFAGDLELRRPFPSQKDICEFIASETVKRGEQISPNTVREFLQKVRSGQI